MLASVFTCVKTILLQHRGHSLQKLLSGLWFRKRGFQAKLRGAPNLVFGLQPADAFHSLRAQELGFETFLIDDVAYDGGEKLVAQRRH